MIGLQNVSHSPSINYKQVDESHFQTTEWRAQFTALDFFKDF